MTGKPAAGSRREFLSQAWRIGALMCLAPAKMFPLRKPASTLAPDPLPRFRSRTVSIRHLPELREWMAELDWSGRLSRNKTWRRYIEAFQYAPPAAMERARSLVVMAMPLKLAQIAFRPGGARRIVLVPSGYVDDGNTLAGCRDLLYRSGVVPPGSRLEPARLPLKQLAVRSGLASYGRNNITFVDDLGSFHQLLAFYSERALEDHWGPLRLLRLCKGCSLCRQACPTAAIRRNDFVIDPARCLSLYNERPAPLPAWIPATAHNALVGCLSCQLPCPGNEEVLGERWDLGEVPEAETAALLRGVMDAKVERTLKERFRRISGGDDLAYIARNLRLVLDAPGAGKAG